MYSDPRTVVANYKDLCNNHEVKLGKYASCISELSKTVEELAGENEYLKEKIEEIFNLLDNDNKMRYNTTMDEINKLTGRTK